MVALNAGLKAAIGDDETGFKGTGDRHYRREAWEFLMAGGSLYNNLDYSFTVDHPDGSAEVRDPTPGGGGPVLRSQLSVLKRFLSGLDFVHMAPSPGLIAGSRLPEGARAYALGKAGEYAVYVGGGPRATLSLKLPPGPYRYEWIDAKTGSALKAGTLDVAAGPGGPATLESPGYAEDIAVKVVATGANR